jgi:hypothetical protein
MANGTIFADASMVDNTTGKPAPLRLTFTEQFNHLLAKTGRDPVSYCGQCINKVEETFVSVMKTLSSSDEHK